MPVTERLTYWGATWRFFVVMALVFIVALVVQAHLPAATGLWPRFGVGALTGVAVVLFLRWAAPKLF